MSTILFNQKTQRNSNVELLRIIAMFMIVLSHICVHSNFQTGAMPFSFNKLFLQFGTLGNLGTDIFIIITGYFLCTSAFKPNNLIKLHNQVWFYSVISFLIFLFCFNYNYTFEEYLMVFLPTIFKEYWFFSAYFILFIFSPFINMFLQTLDQNKHTIFLGLAILLWVVIPTFTKQPMFAGDLILFLLLYSIGAYLKFYPQNVFNNFNVRLGVTIISILLLFLSTTIIDLVAIKFNSLSNQGLLFYNKNSLLTLFGAIGLCSLAIYAKPNYSTFINKLGGCTFGVYLIHENFAFREVVWKQILNLPQFSQSIFLPLIILLVAIGVYAVCTMIEFIRQKTISKPMQEISEKIVYKIKDLFLRLIQK